jgi:uncharacterized surface protein with fasciclin (FAS1) repeats
MIRRLLVALSAVAVLAAAVVPAAEAQPRNPNKDIIQTAQAAGSFNTLLKAIRLAELQGTLKTGGPFTVFAPTDEAFAKLPPATLSAVLADPNLLRSILLYHVVDGAVYARDVVGLTSAETLNGASISIAVVGSDVVLNGSSTVTAVDIAAKNGVIHVIDTVLLPPAGM